MNIVFLEGSISGMNKAKETYKETNQYYRYDTLLFKMEMQLSDLTGNIDPKDLIKEMYQFD